jgi:hypothetical protein
MCDSPETNTFVDFDSPGIIEPNLYLLPFTFNSKESIAMVSWFSIVTSMPLELQPEKNNTKNNNLAI